MILKVVAPNFSGKYQFPKNRQNGPKTAQNVNVHMRTFIFFFFYFVNKVWETNPRAREPTVPGQFRFHEN